MKPVIILGGGGHAKVLASALRLLSREIIGFTDPSESAAGILGIPRLGADEVVFDHAPSDVVLVNGVGSTRVSSARPDIFDRFKQRGYFFETVIHPAAFVAPEAQLGEGVKIMAGAIVQPGVRIGDNSILNTRSSVDHDSDIGCHVHIAPGAILCGSVQIGDRSHIGASSCILQGVRIGASTLLGAASLARGDLLPGVTAFGSPARVIRPT